MSSWLWEEGLRTGSVIAQTPVEDLLTEFTVTGQQPIFEEIVRRYAGMVFGVCLRTCKDAHDAEDATQAVFLALAVQCKSGNPVRHLPAWLRQVAKRTSLDVRKARKRREAREARRRQENNGIINDGERPTEIDLKELGHVLSEELAKLPAKYRLPLVSLYFGGLSREEIAEQLGLKAGALGVRIHRARHMLGERLKRRGAFPDGLTLAVGSLPALDHAFGNALTIRTSAAAAHLMLGHDLSGAVSSQVLSLIHGSAGAISIGRLKVVASVLLLLATAAGAGGAVVHTGDVQNILLNQVKQWIGQLRDAFTLPSLGLRADASNDDPLKDLPYTYVPVKQMPFTPPATLAMTEVETSTPSGTDPSRSAAPKETVAARPVTNANADKNAIEFPTVAIGAGGDRRNVVQDKSKSTDQDTEHADASGAHDQSLLGAGGGGGSSVRASDLPGNYASTYSGDVKISKTSSKSSVFLPGSNDKRVAGPTLEIAKNPGSKGTFMLSSGTLAMGTENIGEQGDGQFVQNDGTNSVTQILIGTGKGGRGQYDQHGGEIVLNAGSSGAPAGIVIGGHGDGELNLGDQFTPGQISASASARLLGPTIVVRASADGKGVLHGWGTVNLPYGALLSSGQVIADGYGHDRPLVFQHLVTIGNPLDNPVHGTNGWFATDGGSLQMPALTTVAGSDVYTWGESVDDSTLDMVNSVRFSIVPPPRSLDVSLLSLDRDDIPALPSGHTFIGVWAIDPSYTTDTTKPAAIDLTIRYDDTLVASLGLQESNLKLWRYDAADGWQRVVGDSFWRDTDANLIGGHVSSLDLFAVSSPEPTGIVSLLTIGAGMLMRRRRRM